MMANLYPFMIRRKRTSARRADGKYPSMGYLLGAIVLFDDLAFDNPNDDPRCIEISRQLYSDRCEIATPETFQRPIGICILLILKA